MKQQDVAQTLAETYLYCVLCGRPHNDPHHIKFRSRGGKDTLENEIPVCRGCHDRVHSEELNLEREGDQLKVIDKTTGEVYYRSLKPHVPSQEDGELAYTVHASILRHKQDIELRFWQMGVLLKELRDRELYKALGCETFNEYLGSPEISIERSQAYKLISICEQAQRLEIAPERLRLIDKDKLAHVLPKATPETVEDVLADCESLSRSDLKEQYKRPGSISSPACWTEHEYVCSSCGATNRVKLKK